MAASEFFRLRFRLRPDLVICPQQSGGRRSWVVKDPIALRYFTFDAEEYSILEALDGTPHLNQLKDRFEHLFPPQRMTTARLTQFLGNLNVNGLLISDDTGQAVALLGNAARQRRDERWRTWTNLLAIRFRGIDPEPFLNWLYPKIRLCFSPIMLSAYLVVAFVAGLLLATEAQEFREQLPTLSEFVGARNMLWLAATLAVTKILHELGHALTCKHFGRECHEMGVTLLIFTPCLYCNVTDAWMLGNRWQRIAISAAGIGVELLLASLAVIGWHFTQPGLLHVICVNVILVCGIGTVVFNGNPFLRYDGYFILSDLLGLPNLWQESRALLRRKISNGFMRDPEIGPSEREERTSLLVGYGLASTVYQTFVMFAVLLFLYRALSAAGFDLLAYLLMSSVPLGLILAGAPALKRIENPSFWQRVRRDRLLVTVLSLITATALFLFLPLRCRLLAPALAQVEDAEQIYVSTPGTLTTMVAEGERVNAGQVIARLEDTKISRTLVELTGQHERMLARAKNLELRATIDADAAAEQVVADEMRADAAKRLEQQRREEEALTLIAPIAGMVIPPPYTSHTGNNESGNLPSWSGTPLESRNTGCFLQRGTLLCTIGDPNRLEVVVFVDESDVQYVRVGQRVVLWFDVGQVAEIEGEVVEIAEGNMQFVPPELASVKELASRPDAAGNRLALETAYQVRVQLGERSIALISGARGQAKIEIEPQTLGRRLYRALLRTLVVKS